MERNSLGDSPEVIKLFETMEQNRIYVEKTRLEEMIAHIPPELLEQLAKKGHEARRKQGREGNR